MEESEFVSRYKVDVIKKACVSEDIAEKMAAEAWLEFGEEDTPEECVDSELSYWGD